MSVLFTEQHITLTTVKIIHYYFNGLYIYFFVDCRLLEWYTKLQGPLVTVVYTDDFNTTDALVNNVISVIKDKVRNYTDVSGIPIKKVRNTRRPKGSANRTYTPKIRYLRTYKPKKRPLRTYKPRTTTFTPAPNDSVVSSTLPAIDGTAVISVTKHTLSPGDYQE